MSKEENIIKYYVLTNKLKDLIRTGWQTWHLERERLESVAEHVYGVQQLAIAMCLQYQYDIDLQKVLFMLAVHETEEIFIGDITQFQISKEEKAKLGHKAVHDLFDSLLGGETVENIILEFDERKTKEALFAYQCDKLECDIQSKLYDEEGCMRYTEDGHVDMEYQKDNVSLNHSLVKELLESGMSWSEMWMLFGTKTYNYDENFRSVSDYARSNNISSFKK
ncbi:MAG: HD domain-containing protein [Bacilli bacterium]|nr:HD domain-containing protein [Bacilli bacterium]